MQLKRIEFGGYVFSVNEDGDLNIYNRSGNALNLYMTLSPNIDVNKISAEDIYKIFNDGNFDPYDTENDLLSLRDLVNSVNLIYEDDIRIRDIVLEYINIALIIVANNLTLDNEVVDYANDDIEGYVLLL